MRKLIFTLGIVALAVSSASAQTVKNNYDNDQLGTYERVTKHGPYLTNRFFDNMFISVAGGVNIYMNNDDLTKASFGKRLQPALDVYLGKWWTPSVGTRIGYSGLKAKSNALAPDRQVRYRQFNTMFIHADFLWHMSNSFGGYNEHRFWNFVPVVGFGYARGWKSSDNHEENKIAATFGLLNNLRLGKVVDLTLEGRYMLVDDHFDGFAGTKKYEGMWTVTAGLSFKLGPKGGFKRPVYVAPADYTPYERRIKSLQDEVAREKSTIDRLNRELEAEKNKQKVVVEKEFTPVTISSFFGIGNAQPTEKEVHNLRGVADAMKAQPHAKFNVTGYADAGTGSVKRNQQLSEMRANNVADILVNTYGVSRSQLVVTGKGGVRNHPNNPSLDRVVIID